MKALHQQSVIKKLNSNVWFHIDELYKKGTSILRPAVRMRPHGRASHGPTLDTWLTSDSSPTTIALQPPPHSHPARVSAWRHKTKKHSNPLSKTFKSGFQKWQKKQLGKFLIRKLQLESEEFQLNLGDFNSVANRFILDFKYKKIKRLGLGFTFPQLIGGMSSQRAVQGSR